MRRGTRSIGVTLQLYDHGAASGRKGACCAGQDIHDARRVADRLGIAHYTIDAEARFAHSVIGAFADSYAAGETPVPCIACNQTVKFADLSALARDLGAERLATGHYVRRVDGPDGAELHRAADRTRDQSWFLFATTRAQLDLCLFPLGGMDGQAGGARRRAAAWAWAWRRSRTARTSVSCRRAVMPTWSAGCGRMRWNRARSSPRTARWSAGTTASPVTRWGRASGWAMRRCWTGERQVVVATEPGRRRVIVGRRGTGTRIGAAARGQLADSGRLMARCAARSSCARGMSLGGAVVRVRGRGDVGAAGRAGAAGARAGLRVLRRGTGCWAAGSWFGLTGHSFRKQDEGRHGRRRVTTRPVSLFVDGVLYGRLDRARQHSAACRRGEDAKPTR